MEIVPVSSAHPLWDAVWRLYVDSFPEWERRREEAHARAAQDSRLHLEAAVDGDRLLGLLFWWEQDAMVYVEHLAVDPTRRGQNIGSALLGDLLRRYAEKQVILEIDPPQDEVSQRRLRFYEHIGFKANDQTFWHTSYAVGGRRHPLILLSWPGVMTPEEQERFLHFIRTVVLSYVSEG